MRSYQGLSYGTNGDESPRGFSEPGSCAGSRLRVGLLSAGLASCLLLALSSSSAVKPQITQVVEQPLASVVNNTIVRTEEGLNKEIKELQKELQETRAKLVSKLRDTTLASKLRETTPSPENLMANKSKKQAQARKERLEAKKKSVETCMQANCNGAMMGLAMDGKTFGATGGGDWQKWLPGATTEAPATEPVAVTNGANSGGNWGGDWQKWLPGATTEAPATTTEAPAATKGTPARAIETVARSLAADSDLFSGTSIMDCIEDSKDNKTAASLCFPSGKTLRTVSVAVQSALTCALCKECVVGKANTTACALLPMGFNDMRGTPGASSAVVAAGQTEADMHAEEGEKKRRETKQNLISPWPSKERPPKPKSPDDANEGGV